MFLCSVIIPLWKSGLAGVIYWVRYNPSPKFTINLALMSLCVGVGRVFPQGNGLNPARQKWMSENYLENEQLGCVSAVKISAGICLSVDGAASAWKCPFKKYAE